ncbi:2-amino-4-hydroxy-6-hydroxymethyldihydropteridine diphosphokinase [Limnohabitans sp. Bal53]|uniref:2-amino-4-hydroxy-6- hydroxymethyldihydropteridine diphosphokinase n=1 Tax=Limnohabitans sp. Bal53 TaxID=1977910 RepID=UPI000D39F84D|nr:2-amino-4-hydroxy-6-hydroxymethyldihydropteridine diphosphokinase [Limnohabitans sp. Bal53]PUE43138.1 2-amino-4-hydroxy-6-hydroxymethyldihydropteridine diphosphokinase [Limnohabitans sp. Bal53]
MRDPVTAYVALGANLGDARSTVLQAFETLAREPGIDVTGRSALYRTAPHEAQGPDFINAVARIDTRLSAPDVLDALQAIEHQTGRLRPYVNAPRTLDLDLLFYGDACMHSPRLTLPHPRWRERAFVLVPLADVWPQRVGAEDLARVAGQAIERDRAAHT